MRFTVCVPTTRPDTLAAAIASVRRQRFTDWELVVVCQGDADVLAAVVERAAGDDPRVRHVHDPGRGASRARNVGVRAAVGEVVAFMDDDCEADENWLTVLDGCFGARPDLALVAGSLVAPPPTSRWPSTCPAFEAVEVVHTPAGAGAPIPDGWGLVLANLAVRRDVFAQIGPFDEVLGAGSVFPAAEETDFALRVEAAAMPMQTTPRARVHHTGGRRHGLRAVYRHKRGYELGNGALTAKMTLAGDPRGAVWRRGFVREALAGVRHGRPHRLPLSLLRLVHFQRGHRACLRAYRVRPPGDIVHALLEPSATAGRS